MLCWSQSFHLTSKRSICLFHRKSRDDINQLWWEGDDDDIDVFRDDIEHDDDDDVDVDDDADFDDDEVDPDDDDGDEDFDLAGKTINIWCFSDEERAVELLQANLDRDEDFQSWWFPMRMISHHDDLPWWWFPVIMISHDNDCKWWWFPMMMIANDDDLPFDI